MNLISDIVLIFTVFMFLIGMVCYVADFIVTIYKINKEAKNYEEDN